MPPADLQGWVELAGPTMPAPALPACVCAGFSTRLGGVSRAAYASNNLALHVGDDTRAVHANRRSLQAQTMANHIAWLEQVHGNRCVKATASIPAIPPRADAVWTDVAGIGLAIMTADCVPVLVWAQDGSVVGAAHAGWRGLRDGVLEALIETMPGRACDLYAWIGPCISRAHYEVGADVWSHFGDGGQAISSHAEDPHKRMLDLSELARQRLTHCGVAAVTLSGLCTYADERFYSYRRARQVGQPETGRMVSLVMIKE